LGLRSATLAPHAPIERFRILWVTIREILVRAILVRAILVRAILVRAIPVRANLVRAILVILVRANLIRAIPVRANLVRAILVRAILVKTILVNTNPARAILGRGKVAKAAKATDRIIQTCNQVRTPTSVGVFIGENTSSTALKGDDRWLKNRRR
jgi:hypothetical protein